MGGGRGEVGRRRRRQVCLCFLCSHPFNQMTVMLWTNQLSALVVLMSLGSEVTLRTLFAPQSSSSELPSLVKLRFFFMF